MNAERAVAQKSVRRWLPVGGLVAVAAAGILATTVAAADQHHQPPPQLVILARSDVPADALASGPVGGALGAPVLITPSNSLHPAAAAAIQDIDPDLVVLAGGTAALSPAVEQAVAALGYQTQRAAGVDRHETAVALAALLAAYSTPNQLIAALEARVEPLAARVEALESLLAGVNREGDTMLLSGLNLQLVNGAGQTTTSNGLGNLILGYNAQRQAPLEEAQRTGSHYLVVGDEHEWTVYGGIVAGLRNTASGEFATVTGGAANTASDALASVTGGLNNTASGDHASILGGVNVTVSTADGMHPN